jgi:hypothetical protein
MTRTRSSPRTFALSCPRSRPASALVVALALLAGTSLPASADPNVAPLGGPAVSDRAPAGPGNRLVRGAGNDEFKKDLADRLPPGGQLRVLRSLMDDDAPAEVRLTDDQRTKIEAILTNQREQMKAFMDANKAKLDAIRAEAEKDRPRSGDAQNGETPRRPRANAEARKNQDARSRVGGEPGAPLPPRGELGKRFQEVMKDAPKPQDAFDRAWVLLNPQQQSFVSAKLEDFKERAGEARKARYQNIKDRKRGNADPSAAGNDQTGATNALKNKRELRKAKKQADPNSDSN